MHYLSDDVTRLFRHVPSLLLNRPGSAQRFLITVVDAGVELGYVLREYPHVRYEPLDFHYLCQQSLCALSDRLLEDLIRDHGWQGAHWASVLVALSSDARYLPYLEEAERNPAVGWIAGIADAVLRPTGHLAMPVCGQLLVHLRTQLAAMPRPIVRLRESPSSDGAAVKAAAVRAAYHQGDLETALLIARS